MTGPEYDAMFEGNSWGLFRNAPDDESQYEEEDDDDGR